MAHLMRFALIYVVAFNAALWLATSGFVFYLLHAGM